MEIRQLGSHGPDVSVIGFGAWEAGGAMWGAEVADQETTKAMEAALDAGVNWIDTAEAYGDGRSEELVGAVARRRPGVMVFTKVAHFVSGCRPDEVRAAIHGSLGRLGLEAVDLYQIHWPNEPEVPVEETWGAMSELREEGLARCIGVSNFDRQLVERCERIAHVDSVQNQFSLLTDVDTRDLLPWLQERGIGYLAYGPLAFGLLAGRFDEQTTFDDDDWRSGKKVRLGYYDELFSPERFPQQLERVERLRPIAQRLGVPMSLLALRAAVEAPGVTGVIAGTRDPDHARDNARAGDMPLDEATMREISDAIRIGIG